MPTNLIADRSDPLSSRAAGKGRRRARPAARPRRQGDAGARRAGGAAEGRQSARRHHAHRRWAPIICARSASPASKAFSAAALRKRWKTPATARSPRKASTRSSALLGNDFRRKLKPLAESRWAHDPFARGSYSHALPGHAGDRAVLAAPVDGRLFFAGEATSPNFFSTAHGAGTAGSERRRKSWLRA